MKKSTMASLVKVVNTDTHCIVLEDRHQHSQSVVLCVMFYATPDCQEESLIGRVTMVKWADVAHVHGKIVRSGYNVTRYPRYGASYDDGTLIAAAVKVLGSDVKRQMVPPPGHLDAAILSSDENGGSC